MKQKHTIIFLSVLVLILSGCSSKPKYYAPEPVYKPEIRKIPHQPIPNDILQKYKRIRSITGEILDPNQSYALIQKE